MIKFTPGPWRTSSESSMVIISDVDDFKVVATVQTHAFAYDEDYANARLIAAAPEMYEALKKINYYTTHPDFGSSLMKQAYFDTLRWVSDLLALIDGKEVENGTSPNN